MKVPACVAAVSCLCPLVVFLCVVCQSCYGTRVDLSPLTNPNPDLDTNPWLKSLPEPTTLPSPSPEKPVSPLEPSQLSTSSQNFWSKSQLKPRFDTVSYLTDNRRSNTIFSSTFSQATLSSNTGVKLQHMTKSSNSKQRLTNPKPRAGSLPQPKPKVFLKSPTKLSSVSSLNQRSNSSGTMNPSTYYNVSPASLSNFKSHSKPRPSSQPGTDAKSKIFYPNSRSSIRAQRNQTKLLETDKDSHHRPKRGWIWNQFFVLEEHIGPDPQYIGKVRHIYLFLCGATLFSETPFLSIWSMHKVDSMHLLVFVFEELLT